MGTLSTISAAVPSKKRPFNAEIVQSLSSHGVQLCLLKWLCIVFDFVESIDELHSMYGFIFCLLDFAVLRPPVCQLLFRLTRREDVHSFRMKKLLSLRDRFPFDGHVYALLGLFAKYNPRYSLPARRGTPVLSLLRPVDSTWRDVVEKVQLTYNPLAGSFGKDLSLTFKEQRIFVESTDNVSAPPRKVTRTSSHPFAVHDDNLPLTHVGVDEIVSVEELALHFLSVSVPPRLSSILESEMLQHFLTIQRDGQALRRLASWLEFRLDECVMRRDSMSRQGRSEAEAFLDAVANFCERFREVPPEVERFVVKCLQDWDGVSFVRPLSRIICLLRPSAYEDLYAEVLQPLQRSFFSLCLESKCLVLQSITAMVRHWVAHDWSILAGVSKRAAALAATAGARSSSYASDEDMSHVGPCLFSIMATGVDYMRSLYEVVHYSDKLHTLALIFECDHPMIMSAALDFSELLSCFHRVHKFPFVVRPSTTIVYHSFLASSPHAVSRICSLIPQYKAEFGSLKKNVQSSNVLSFPQGLEELEVFNRFIRDFSYCLWKPIAFSSQIKASDTLLFNLPRSNIEAYHAGKLLSNSLSIAHMPSLRGMCSQFSSGASAIDVPAPDFVQLTLEKHKFEYVEFLREAGMHGLHEFLYTFVSELLRRVQPAV
jgi:hypothetical protein